MEMTQEERAQEEQDAKDVVLVEVLKPFTALNARLNPQVGTNPADRAKFRRKDAMFQARQGLSRIIHDPKKDGPFPVKAEPAPVPPEKGKRAA